jgi:hypothetical protein
MRITICNTPSQVAFTGETAHHSPSKETIPACALVARLALREHPSTRSRILALLVLFITIGLVHSAWGQGTLGGISGRVTDSSGASIPGSSVHVTNIATNVSSDVKTSEIGDYSVHELIPGLYNVSVTKAGFKTAVQTSVIVSTATISSLNITLGVGASTETITVMSEGAPLVTESAEIGTVMPQQMVLDLPIQVGGNATIGASGRRQIETFAFLTPGVTGNQYSKSINGAPGFTQEILYDGVDAQNIGAPGVIAESSPPYESVSEFKIENTMYPVEYGFGLGVENFTLRSGTNQFHGDAFDFLRNNALDARGYYNSNVPLHQNEFGVTAGGPVVLPHIYNGRGKTFFFASYDGFRLTGGNASGGYVTIPSLQERTGDFSDFPYPIYDPATTTLQANGTYTRTAFANNQIPANRFSTVAKNLIALLPNPDRPGYSNNYLSRAQQPTSETSYSGKIDHQINERSNLHGSFWWVNGHTTVQGPLAGNPLDYTYRITQTSGGGFRLSYDTVITPKFVNQVAFGYTPVAPTWSNWLIDPTKGNATLKIPGVSPDAPGWPQINISGYQELGNSQNQGVPITFKNWSGRDTATWNHNKQQVSFGVEYRHRNMHFVDLRNSAGGFNFSNYSTSNPADTANFGTYGNGFASLLLGQVDSGSVYTPTSYETFGDTFWAFYARDVIQVSPKLTLTLGMRYELPFYPVGGRGGNFSRLNLGLPNPAAGNIPGALEFSGKAPGAIGTFNTLYQNPHNDWGPRVSAAYQLDKKTVLRAGLGNFFVYTAYGSYNSAGEFGAGFSLTQSFASNNQDVTPAFLLDNGIPVQNVTLPNTNPSLLNGGVPTYVNRNAWKPADQLAWTTDIQRELPWSVTADLAYVGSRTSNIQAGVENVNQVNPSYLSLGSTLNADINSAAAQSAGIKSPYPGFTGSVAQALRPFPQFSGISDVFQPTGYLHYNSMQLRVQKRLSNNLSLLIGYTFSKANGLLAGSSLNTYDQQLEKGISSSDQTHTTTISWTYALPFGKGQTYAAGVNGFVNQIIGGWQINAVQSYWSGTPLSFGGGTALPLFAGIGNRPNRNPGVAIKANISTSGRSWNPYTDRLFNPGAFSLPAPYTFGNAAPIYSSVRNPFYRDEDISIFKNVPIKAGISLQWRTEMFNALNRVSFSGPNTTVGDPNFGIMQGTNTPRVIQMALKVLW